MEPMTCCFAQIFIPTLSNDSIPGRRKIARSRCAPDMEQRWAQETETAAFAAGFSCAARPRLPFMKMRKTEEAKWVAEASVLVIRSGATHADGDRAEEQFRELRLEQFRARRLPASPSPVCTTLRREPVLLHEARQPGRYWQRCSLSAEP